MKRTNQKIERHREETRGWDHESKQRDGQPYGEDRGQGVENNEPRTG